ncbi:MAG: glycosyl hydrolase [Flavobacteriaceae bacterium]|nr:glycosyl hydrolase [Flavobacteriaceae bacterium]
MKTIKMTLLTLILTLLIPETSDLKAQTNTSMSKMLENYSWRAIGPANMGGRVTDIDGVPGDPSTFYVSGADGGIFKTTNGGVSFNPIFENQRAYSIGSLTIAPSDNNILWVGTGEGDPRNSVGYGWGVYKSIDGGMSWKHLGLKNTERIKRIVVDPKNPNIACVCALGKEWGPNKERGVFKTIDGGKTWKKILYIDENTGCADIAMEDNNSRIMYAGMWTFRRKPWRFDDGGKNTALYRTMDGGETWKKIMNGLPDKDMARPGVHIAQSEPNIIYLMTEFEGGGTAFKSEDRGESWEMVNDDPNINFRPFYYSDVRVDPNQPNVLFSISGRLSRSKDSGNTWEQIAKTVHGDHQALWIDPTNSKYILNGSDGGFQRSFDGGDSWEIINNIELSQFYQMEIDNKKPYNIYGGLQDNGTWVGPSNSLYGAGILKRHWKGLAYGDGYFAVPIPGEEHFVYTNLQGGVPFLVDSRYGNVQTIHPYPKIVGSAGDAIEKHKYRFNWDSPIMISPHDPETVYVGGNVVFKSNNRGKSWEVISPDLTTNDKSKQRSSGGTIYQDNTAAEFHCTILYLAESPIQKGVIWAGTDDGNIQVTLDGGKNWSNLKNRIKGLPEYSWISKIHASEHNAGTAIIVIDQHRMNDFRPYIFMTEDFGKSWRKITSNLPSDDYVKVVRQDPHNPNLLFAGMEHGIFASWNMGKSWEKINNNLPNVSVRDLRIQARDRDLIVATHGRGVFILDDIHPIEELKNSIGKPIHLFPIREGTLWNMYWRIENLGDRTYAAKNPEYGTYINFSLQKDANSPVNIDIFDKKGSLVTSLEMKDAKKGVNRVIWDLGYDAAVTLENKIEEGFSSNEIRPKVVPGEYTARINYEGLKLEEKITVVGDNRIKMPTDDYRKKLKALLTLRDLLSKTHKLIDKVSFSADQLEDLIKKLNNDSSQDTNDAKKIHKKIVEHKFEFLMRPPPSMTYRQKPRLREEIRSLMSAIDNTTNPPTAPQIERIASLIKEVDEQEETILSNESELLNLNRKLSSLPQILY